MTTVLEQALSLSVEEKLRLIGVLWDSMADHPESIPVPEWQLKELQQRMDAHRAHPETGKTWDEVKQAIRDGKK